MGGESTGFREGDEGLGGDEELGVGCLYYVSDRTGDIVEQIETLKDTLVREKELRRLVVRLRWRPRWFSSGCERMTGCQARALLEAV